MGPVVRELAAKLIVRGLSMRVFTPRPHGGVWVVWLHSGNNPALGPFVGEGDELEGAVGEAIGLWDQGVAVDEVPRLARGGGRA